MEWAALRERPNPVLMSASPAADNGANNRKTMQMALWSSKSGRFWRTSGPIRSGRNVGANRQRESQSLDSQTSRDESVARYARDEEQHRRNDKYPTCC
jgi:hypothetical protein